MRLLRYTDLKSSGVEFLGDVPKDWAIIRLKYTTGLLTEKCSQKQAPVGLENIEGWTGRFFQTESNFEGAGIRFREGDLLFGKLRPYLAKIWLAEFNGEAVGDFFVLRPNSGIYGRFLAYTLLNRNAIAHIDASTIGAKMPRVDWEFFSNLRIVTPPMEKQIAISSFLDTETAKIDALVAGQRRLIELLNEKRQAVVSHAVTKGLNHDAPMKPSGIEWLGDVPEHWAVLPLKRVAYVNTGIAKGKDVSGRETIVVPYLRVANVQDGYLNLQDVGNIEIPVNELERYRLRQGDVLMNEGGDYDKLGRGCIWDGQIDPCISQNHVFAVRPVGVTSEWISQIIASAYAQFYFMTRSKQSTNLASISSTNLMKLPVPLPPTEEQSHLVAYLKRVIAEFAKLVAESERAILLLQERRTALISAAVTGKIDVRNYQPDQAA